MQKEIVSVIYDRKNEVRKSGRGKVEIRIYLGNGIRKYVTVHTCDPFEWKEYRHSEDLRKELVIYKHVVETMERNGEELTIDNINNHLGIDTKKIKEQRAFRKEKASSDGFIQFFSLQMSKEDNATNTNKNKVVVFEAVKRFGKLKSFADLTPMNIKGFDDFLRKEDSSRSLPTLFAYHKILKHYTKLAYQLDYILKDPYNHPLCKFKRGSHKERNPLTEDELVQLRNLDLPARLDRVRDLFVFCAYTGLAYIDSQKFDFMNMTEIINDTAYIDGKRIKTGNSFYTPILKPAMDVLKKYNYRLPKISNQKANAYLHCLEVILNLHKPMTTHVARHSFATLLLSNDVPMENVGRMLGHRNIKTTQIYCKILNSTIERHTAAVTSKIR